MKFFGFIIRLAYGELLVHFVSCGLNSNSKNEYALVVRPYETGYEFAPVSRTVEGKFIGYISRKNDRQLYYLCPHKEDQTLLKIEKRVTKEYEMEKQICKNEIEPSIYKVNIRLAIPRRQDTPIHKYGIGFTIDDTKFKDIWRTTYESLNENHYFLPMIYVYVYAELKLFFAVSYDIITTDTRKKLENTTLTYKSTNLFPDKIEQFYKNQESKLKEKLGLHYDAEKHLLELGSLVNENDFIINIWKKTARYKLHQILIWKHNIQMWRDIQEYARHIGAFNNSETTITAGIGNVLTISDTEDQKYIMKWDEGEDTVFIPELYWLAIKYYEDRETTGMVIIMHNDVVDGTNVKKICEKNPCVGKKIWYLEKDDNELEKSVYCCKLKTEVLAKLGMEMIHKEFYFYKGDSYYSFPPHWVTSPVSFTNPGEK